MKTLIFAICFTAAVAHGTLVYNNNFAENTAIPDGNPVGVAFTETFNLDPNAGDLLNSLTVTLNISGGYNGDLYAYLASPDGTMVTLLNQPGVTGSDPFGYGGSGLNVTLSDSGASSIQTTSETDGTTFTGNYQAAGSLADFNGSPVNGAWTLFFADLSSGGGTATLNSWSLNITPITTLPEPKNTGLLAGCALLAMCGLQLWRDNRSRRGK